MNTINNENAKILVVEDDVAILNLIKTALSTVNYNYDSVENGSEAVAKIISYKPDVILLDLGLPDMDGVEIIEKVRLWSDVPIIVVSARSDDKDKVGALDLGADDYLPKPFSVDELMARIRVAIRRGKSNDKDNEDSLFVNGDLKIDYPSGCAYIKDEQLHLTPTEFKMLCLFAKNIGKVLTYKFINDNIWNPESELNMSSQRVFMATVRKKIEPDTATPKYIQTHTGVGYRMLRVEDEE